MYKFDNGQISILEFGQPIGMKLHEGNRWVEKAMTLPWDAIERRYAALLTNQKGNVAKPLRLGLGACIIQAEYGYSDIETTLHIQETAYLQYFCGYKAYDDSKPPFDPSLMVYFRKRLTPEILGEINEMILAAQSADGDDTDDDGNGGAMILDATCAPSQIKYPQDTALLNEAQENTEALIDALHTSGAKKPRTYRKRAHKDYPPLGRPRKDAILDKKQNYRDECERVEVEHRFSLAKRCCGLGLITVRLQETACHCMPCPFCR